MRMVFLSTRHFGMETVMKELIIYMIVTGFLLQLVPESYRKYVGLYAGMILILIVTELLGAWLPF